MNFAKTALDLFYKTFGRRIIKTAADSKWLANTIRLLKQKAHKPKTSDVAQKVREGLNKPGEGFKSTTVPKTKKFTPKIVPKAVKPIKVPEQTKNILNIKSTLKGRPVKIIRDKKTGKIFEEKVIGPAKVIYGRFPKKPPRKPKADGGSIDKSLPGRSRDI